MYAFNIYEVYSSIHTVHTVDMGPIYGGNYPLYIVKSTNCMVPGE